MLTKTGTLRFGLKVGGALHKEFELRDCTAADYFDAENEAGTDKQLKFNAALVARQLVRIGDFQGPFNSALLGTLRPVDVRMMIDARDQLELEGNGQPPAGQDNSTASG